MTGYEALRGSAAWMDVSNRGKIRVIGEDRARLIHAMSTNDVKNLPPRQGLYAFFLNDKGRILADAYIYNLGESLWLDTEPETAAKLRDHLERYIIADDAELEDQTESWAAVELAGPEAIDSAEALGIPASEAKYGVEDYRSGFVARVSGAGVEGLRLFLPVDRKEEVMRTLEAAHIPNAKLEEARAARIENGVPRYGEEISERYLVQETQAMHALHTNKGCYLGQEIVERVRSRGQVHRILLPVLVDGAQLPPAGTKLTAGGQPVGEIASAVYSPALKQVVALAYVRTEAAQSKPEMTIAGTEPPQHARIRE